MMKRLILLLATVAALSAMTGCDKDDDRRVEIPSAVEGAFGELFPGATQVGWSDRGGYLVASFRDADAQTRAWFAADGAWRMTETDLTYAQLPEAVRTAFETGEYAAWRVDDVEQVLRVGLETVYVLEVERGKDEYELIYSPEGILLSAVPDTDGDDDNDDLLPADLPATVTEFLRERYPDARIVDAERERGMYEVEIVDGRTPRELLFSETGAWVWTKTEIRPSELPAAVADAVRASQYGAWIIEDADRYEDPDGEWYVVELEEPRTDLEAELRVRADGTIF